MPDLAAQLPSAVRAAARWERLGPQETPVMLVEPEASDRPPPVVLWMHGRTVNKELDAGRYLRWIRSGIAACAIDLPGHGERLDESRHGPERALGVIDEMVKEIDAVVEELAHTNRFDMTRVAIGGMSGGGMVTLARLCSPHPFVCATVEATSGSWADMPRLREYDAVLVEALDPINHLRGWREIPMLAVHARKDEWVTLADQKSFIEAVRTRYSNPDLVEFVVYEETGAPFEHAGFGRLSADAKGRQLAFLKQHLLGSDAT